MYKAGDLVKLRNRRHVVVRRSLHDSYVVKPVECEGGQARQVDPFTVHRLALAPDRAERTDRSDKPLDRPDSKVRINNRRKR